MNLETEIAVLKARIEEKEKTIKTITDLLNTLSANIANHPATDFFGNGICTSNNTITYLGNKTASQTTSLPSSYYISTGISDYSWTCSSVTST